jgi:hypothetical protein
LIDGPVAQKIRTLGLVKETREPAVAEGGVKLGAAARFA